MDASKVTVSLHSPLLTGKRKRELRTEIVKAYIRSKPYGKRITLTELQQVLNYKSGQAADSFMKTLARNGEVVRHAIGKRSFFFTVPGEIKVSTANPVIESAIDLGRAIEQHKALDKGWTFEELETLAMKFNFYHPKGTVAEFLTYLKETK